MSLVSRLERNISKLEKHIEKEYDKIGVLHKKFDHKKINSAEFHIKKNKIDDKIKEMDTRMRVLKGALAKEKKHLEEKAEEKQRNREEKAGKKEEAKKREKSYFEWSEKNERKSD